MEERRKAKADIQKYRELDIQKKKRYNKAKEHWINTQCEELEANNEVNSKTVHQKIKEVIGKKATSKTGCILSKDGDILMEKEDILNRWPEYITELYHDDRGPPPIINNEEGPQILEEEVEKALKKMKKKARPQDQAKYNPKCYPL